MKKFELILQGNKVLVVDQLKAKQIEKAIEDKVDLIKVGDTSFTRSMYKGLFPIREEVSLNKEAWIQSNREWHEECLRLSKRHIDEKVTSELVVRIFPGLKLNNITLTDATIAAMEANIKAYFEIFPNNPRCPMKIWWPFIAEFISPVNKKTKKRANPNLIMGKWWDYISRNDGAIEEWKRYNLIERR
ncbi:MAG: hypothetical protein AABY22_02140 [Nanoarchaeota archaeon]